MNRYNHPKPVTAAKQASLKQEAAALCLLMFLSASDQYLLSPERRRSIYHYLKQAYKRVSTTLVLPTGPALSSLESQYAKKPKNPV